MSSFALLSLLGHDCIGARQFRHPQDSRSVIPFVAKRSVAMRDAIVNHAMHDQPYMIREVKMLGPKSRGPQKVAQNFVSLLGGNVCSTCMSSRDFVCPPSRRAIGGPSLDFSKVEDDIEVVDPH
jgi:hypothetical protein